MCQIDTIQVFDLDILKTFKTNIFSINLWKLRNIFKIVYSKTVWVDTFVSKIGSSKLLAIPKILNY